MEEEILASLTPLVCPPPLPPRRKAPIPPPLPPRQNSQSLVPAKERSNSVPIPNGNVRTTSSVSRTSSIYLEDDTQLTTNSSTTIISSETSTSTQPASQGPNLYSMALSFVLREPLERAHGRVSTFTAITSLFQTKNPAPPPFDYSTLVDHAILAAQLAFHDPQTRQQKRLPLVLTLSVGAFLVAATGLVSRHFGWVMLVLATWLGPARFLVREMWYVFVGLWILSFLVDFYPMLSLMTLLWNGAIIFNLLFNSKTPSGTTIRPKPIELVHRTAVAIQKKEDFKPVALDIVQGVSQWWAFRQSEPERLRRAESKAAKQLKDEQKKADKLLKAETMNAAKKAEEEAKVKKQEEKEAKKIKQEEETLEKQRKKTEAKLSRSKTEKIGESKPEENEFNATLRRTRTEA